MAEAVQEPAVNEPVESVQADLLAEPVAEPGKEPANGKGAESEPAPAKGKKSIVAEPEPAAEPKPAAPYWPEDWRQKMADHVGAGNAKAVKKELKRLERFTDPIAVFSFGREAEGKLTSGGLVKIPGKDASEEDVAAFHQSLGAPGKKEGYLEDLTLENGAVFGDADKEGLEWFTESAYKNGLSMTAFKGIASDFMAFQEEKAATFDDDDDKFRIESDIELKEQYGATFRREMNSIKGLFTLTPGGTAKDNDGSFYNRLMAGRMADGQIIGNDPDMVRWLAWARSEIYPGAAITEDGDQSGKTIDAELSDISKVRKTDRRTYNKDDKMQARERELLDAKTKIQARV